MRSGAAEARWAHNPEVAGSNPASANRRWHNALPAWIVNHASYAKLGTGQRATLQAIADRCDKPDARGDLMYAFGGRSLADFAGLSQRTFWRHLAKLERLGFVVTLWRGGTRGLASYGNKYGIPGRSGSLDGRRCSRTMQRMATDPGGQEPHHPVIVPPGGQVPIWREPRDKMSLPPCQSVTPPSPLPAPSGGWGFQPLGYGGVPRRSLGRLQREDVADPIRLARLHAVAMERGLLGGSEADAVWFYAAAAHALRIGKNPPAVLLTMLRRRGQRDLFITGADEDEGQRMRRAAHGLG